MLLCLKGDTGSHFAEIEFQDNRSAQVQNTHCRAILNPETLCRAVKAVLNRVRSEGAEVMIASHNQYSVESAVAEMYELDLDPRTRPVFFGQLLGGMQIEIDTLTPAKKQLS